MLAEMLADWRIDIYTNVLHALFYKNSGIFVRGSVFLTFALDWASNILSISLLIFLFLYSKAFFFWKINWPNLRIFLGYSYFFRKFEPQYSYKVYSYKNAWIESKIGYYSYYLRRWILICDTSKSKLTFHLTNGASFKLKYPLFCSGKYLFWNTR